ncbi:MAG: hypothetical protein ACJ746_27395 [Bryobacteraceae bacterium]
MADLFYPQLRTGAIAHYPIRKTSLTRTVANVVPGGSVLMYPDDPARRISWSWDYVGLTLAEVGTVQNFFSSCNGPLRPFTFLDPTGNLLSASSNFAAPAWQVSSALKVAGKSVRPFSDTPAVTVVNEGQASQELSQTLAIPSDYTYCFSIYVGSATPQSVTLFRRSVHSEQAASFDAGPKWKRIWTSGSLNDDATGFSVGLKLSAGQQLSISAAQLEVQPGISPYRDRPETGDLYPNAHWAMEELAVRHFGPNNCSISVSIEA